MEGSSRCPGCGVELPASGLRAGPGSTASPECELVYGELIGFEMSHLARLGRFHQLSVDADGAQHPDAAGSGIRLAYSLVGLYLALERGAGGLQVREAHQRTRESGIRQAPSRAATTSDAWASASLAPPAGGRLDQGVAPGRGVPRGGVEPPPPCGERFLRPPRLPIPPPRRGQPTISFGRHASWPCPFAPVAAGRQRLQRPLQRRPSQPLERRFRL